MVTLAQLRKIATSLPEVTEKPCFGTPAWYVHMKHIGAKEVRELLTDRWRMCAPKKLVDDFEASSR